jgi:hypothetical protein
VLRVSSAITNSPSAVISSTETRLSQARPHLRSSQPDPPPSVSPATPVVDTRPPVVPSQYGWHIRSKSPQVAPPPTRAIRASASTWTVFSRRRSTTSPPSLTPVPATPCPPPRTAISSPCSTPYRTAAETSAADSHWAINAGRLSTIALNTVRACS